MWYITGAILIILVNNSNCLGNLLRRVDDMSLYVSFTKSSCPFTS